MTMTDAAPPTVTRYKQLLDATLTAATAGRALPAPADAPPNRLSVDRGAAWAWLHDEPASAAALALLGPLFDESTDPYGVTVVDAGGASRPAYLGLLCYAAFQAVAASDRVLLDDQAETVARWVDALVETPRLLATFGPQIPADAGGDAVAAAWAALAARRGAELLHDDGAIRAAGRAMSALVARQRPDGAFLHPTARDNLESYWFHELQLAHAVGSFALQSSDPMAMASARRAAAYHLAETQPDHATNQPWGLTAFLTNPDAHIMADGQLHAASILGPGGLDGVSLILLADALYSLRRQGSR